MCHLCVVENQSLTTAILDIIFIYLIMGIIFLYMHI